MTDKTNMTNLQSIFTYDEHDGLITIEGNKYKISKIVKAYSKLTNNYVKKKTFRFAKCMFDDKDSFISYKLKTVITDKSLLKIKFCDKTVSFEIFINDSLVEKKDFLVFDLIKEKEPIEFKAKRADSIKDWIQTISGLMNSVEIDKWEGKTVSSDLITHTPRDFFIKRTSDVPEVEVTMKLMKTPLDILNNPPYSCYFEYNSITKNYMGIAWFCSGVHYHTDAPVNIAFRMKNSLFIGPIGHPTNIDEYLKE